MTERELERERIRIAATDAAELSANGSCGPQMTDAMFYHQLILAVCNLAETVDARGAAVRDGMQERRQAGDWL